MTPDETSRLDEIDAAIEDARDRAGRLWTESFRLHAERQEAKANVLDRRIDRLAGLARRLVWMRDLVARRGAAA